MKTKEVEANARRKALARGGTTREILSWYAVYCMVYNVVPFLGTVKSMNDNLVNKQAKQCKLV